MLMFFKLLNGEEIVAEIDDTEEDGWSESIDMEKPMRSIMTNQGPALIPYPCNHIAVNTSHILFKGVPNDDVSNAYRQATSGIVTPKRKIQMPLS
jgi:hypothetical protein